MRECIVLVQYKRNGVEYSKKLYKRCFYSPSDAIKYGMTIEEADTDAECSIYLSDNTNYQVY